MVEALIQTAWRGLPWLAVLTIWASAAYGMNAGLAADGEVAATAVERPVSIEPCDPTSARMLRYAVSNSWIPSDFQGYCRGD